jgi:hypothetical protein
MYYLNRLVSTPVKSLNDSNILLDIGRTIELTKEASIIICGRASEQWLRSKLDLGILKAEDLVDERTLELVEQYLAQKYPQLRVRDDLHNLLYDPKVQIEARKYMSKLVNEGENKGENGEEFEISIEKLEDPEYLAALEAKLQALYPHLDLSQDPAQELLEGTIKKETERFIDEIVS